ncbi:MAG: phosphoadenosine phosphosulfate reductase family protein [Candidatus Aenigmarchaeota archaeon]|nr:phosphoadenosine phosphosulfate reductase family protein [Candidatus Aenigmarchaeota archaeon]
MKPKAISLFSGGLDSPVAMYIMSKKYNITPLHFVLYPYYCRGNFETTLKIASKLKDKIGFKKLILFPWRDILAQIVKKTNKKERKYQCILCRKGMYKVAELLAKKLNAKVLIDGTALAQKASQTLDNMYATHKDIKIPILHPLLGMDKNEIIELAKQHNIYFPIHAGCCSAVPKRPITHSDIDHVEYLYKKLEIEKIIKKLMKKALITKTINKDIFLKIIK